MSLKVANTIVLTDDLRGRFSNTVFTNGAYLVMPEDPSVEYQFQGTISGYSSGGDSPTNPNETVIEKFPFATDTNATDVGDLSVERSGPGGAHSQSHGYTVGGGEDNPSPPPGQSPTNIIDKFPFAVDTNASDVGDLTGSVVQTNATSATAPQTGYRMGGAPAPPATNVIDRFPFAADNNAIDVGDLTTGTFAGSDQASRTNGYLTGGGTPTFKTTIEKFPFASDTNSGDAGDLQTAKRSLAGASSETHGFSLAGRLPPGAFTTKVEKFPFATDGDAVEVGDLVQSVDNTTGCSSVDFGYVLGGRDTPSVKTDSIQKFPFAVDSGGSGTDVGNLTSIRSLSAGTQR